MGLYWDNGKEHGNYYSTLGLYIGIMENKMETIGSVESFFFKASLLWLRAKP